ncbi:caspase family protein [Janthinobacterium sp. PSPC3-1]|uniref:caspase family protein n=1 Tax=Janthinobacterium sp. PSPC3-1 TaxID=2804653 RepID=UPI003CF875A3
MADHAILIGIRDYPTLLGDEETSVLQGPVNDVEAVKAWLLDCRGGGFADDSTIHVIISDEAAPADGARPTDVELEEVLLHLALLAQKSNARGTGLRVGERLYLFMAGHGFSPERTDACLYTANARPGFNAHIHATGWLNWLQESAFFEEFVLWMDCCMDRMATGPVRDPLLNPPDGGVPPRASFVAFAAQRPLKAVENPIPADDNKVHGVFTWALLQGLRGAAADQNGRVTGRSLADWVRNAQAALMTDAQRENSNVALDPEIIQEDPGLIFVRGIEQLRYRVTLYFPPEANGRAAFLWSGVPPAARPFTVDGTDHLLAPGLYLVQVPDIGLSQGFEVLADMRVVVRDSGPQVDATAAGKIFTLNVDPGEPGTEIFVIDQRLSLVDRDAGRLSTSLPFGLFKVKTRIGRGLSQRIILLDSQSGAIDPTDVTRLPSSVVPLPGTSSSLAAHTLARAQELNASSRQAADGDDASLMLMVRAWSAPNSSLAHTELWKDVAIVDASGAMVFDGTCDTRLHRGDADPYAVGSRKLAPGNYFLRQKLSDGSLLEQSLLVCKGWRLEVYLLRRGVPGKDSLSARPRVSLMMHRMDQGAPQDETEDRMAESLRLALADERRILNADLEQMLAQENLANPIFGLTGAHLLLLERERDRYRDVSKLDAIVRNLQQPLGATHPDWVALALQCSKVIVPRDVVLDGPPMFARSWPLLVRAAHEGRIEIPAAMWSRMQAPASLPPFMAWSIDEGVKRAAWETLRQALQEPPSPVMAMPMNMAPASAVARHSRARLARARKWQLPPSALDLLPAAPP